MIAKYLQNNIYLMLIAVLFTGCFKEESPIQPVSQNGIRIPYSLYDYQTFYDFSTNLMQSNPNSKWDIAFENGAKGWHIRINYSIFCGIYQTGSSDFLATSYSINERKWLYDASSGNPDSTAVGNWTEVTSEGPQVFLFGMYDGVKYNPVRKLKFLYVSDTLYAFAYSKLDNSDADTFMVHKNENYNYTYFSFSKRDTVIIEPVKTNWDILFTQYTTTLYTRDGIPIPYVVRGIYLNPHNVKVAIDSITKFTDISSNFINSYPFSAEQDFIGYRWKSVEINQTANTAKYTVNKTYSYMLKDSENQYFKFRFLSYVNDSLVVGFPMFEKEKL